jgi:hypothetical protein
MPKVWTLLVLAVMAFPKEVLGDDGVMIEPFGCASAEVFYNILNLAEPLSAKKRAKLIAKNCLSLADTRYLVVGEGDGLAKIRVFPTPGDWATSSVVFTLDEMLDRNEMLDPSAIAHQ